MTPPPERIPWEVVETIPGADADLLAQWDSTLATASCAAERIRALVASALVRYWAVTAGVISASEATVAHERRLRVEEAVRLARHDGDADLLATALLGVLYACWGPDQRQERDHVIRELDRLRPRVQDLELSLRILEWVVLGCFDRGDVESARRLVTEFGRVTAGAEVPMFDRRADLWCANIAMLEGRLDEAVRINQEVVSATSTATGSPFSFQNAAITVAIERYLRHGLADVVDAVRSIRASSPRVAANWDTGLAFTLAEIGEHEEAADVLARLATDDFTTVRRDLNWLVTMHLVGLVVLRLDDEEQMTVVLEQLRPHAHLDSTHGSGYASYGPVGRVVGSLAGRLGRVEEAEHWFDHVLRTRSPGPWTSLTRLDAARLLRHRDPARALRDADQACTELAAYDMAGFAREASTLAHALVVEGYGGPAAVRIGRRWQLHHPSGRAEVTDGVGIRHLLALLARPGEPIGCLALEGADRSIPWSSIDDPSIDAAARSAYRRRLDELEGRPDRGGGEAAFLRRELAGARHVRAAAPELERSRVRVTKAIARVASAIEVRSPPLADHLRRSVSTGRRCLYAPDDGVPWRIIDADPGASEPGAC